MTTFSQLVDDLVVEHLRPDLTVSIAAYTNQVIRECHADPEKQTPIYFGSNRLEDEITIATTPGQWPIPMTTRFQALESMYDVTRGRYVKQKNMNRLYGEDDSTISWYRSGAAIVIFGSSVNDMYKLAWMEFPRNLPFYPSGVRPALWDTVNQAFTYLPAFDVNDTTRANARDLTTNWLLERWAETIKQGVRSKIYTRLRDLEGARLAYSSYQALLRQLINSESMEIDYKG